jgi:hypothetical protein
LAEGEGVSEISAEAVAPEAVGVMFASDVGLKLRKPSSLLKKPWLWLI